MHRLMIDLPDRIETERLYLRPYRAGDGAWYFAAGQRNREHLARFEDDNAILSAANEHEAEILVRDLAADWVARKVFFMGIFDKNSDKFVGQIYIGVGNWDIPEFQIGYFADVDNEGKGYVSEAVTAVLDFLFEYFKAHRVSLETNEINDRSLRVAERCGFLREGLFRQNRKNPDGSFSNTLYYAILRSDWEAGK